MLKIVEVKQLEAKAVWTGWKKPSDAIDWAHQELPHLSIKVLLQHMNSLQPINGKKAPAWVEFAEKQKVR